MGTDVQLEIAMKQRGAWKKTKRTFTLDEDAGIVLLDAAMTVARASADQKRAEPLARGTWAIEELQSDVGGSGVHAVRLVPCLVAKAKKGK
jgi:hypothetical protein